MVEKFYVESLKKYFDSKEEALKAEAEEEKKLAKAKLEKEERAAEAKVVDEAFKKANDAYNEAYKTLNEFCKKYGGYHTTIDSNSISSPRSLFDLFFKDLFLF